MAKLKDNLIAQGYGAKKLGSLFRMTDRERPHWFDAPAGSAADAGYLIGYVGENATKQATTAAVATNSNPSIVTWSSPPADYRTIAAAGDSFIVESSTNGATGRYTIASVAETGGITLDRSINLTAARYTSSAATVTNATDSVIDVTGVTWTTYATVGDHLVISTTGTGEHAVVGEYVIKTVSAETIVVTGNATDGTDESAVTITIYSPITAIVGRVVAQTGPAGKIWAAPTLTKLAYWTGDRWQPTVAPVGTTAVSGYWVTPAGIFCLRSNQLDRTTDGFAAFSNVIANFTDGSDANRSASAITFMPKSLCYVGATSKYPCVILFFEYLAAQSVGYTNDPAVWASTDGGANWSKLFNAAQSGGDQAIRHFHGATWIPANTANGLSGEGRLIVYTGDGTTGDQQVLLFCDDIDDLIDDAPSYRGRWGLDTANRSNLDAGYSIGTIDAATQRFRTTCVVDGNDGYFYWGVDQGASTGQEVLRADHSTRTVEAVGSRTTGILWNGLRTTDGTIVFFGDSEWDGVSAIGAGNDEYLRVIAITDGGADWKELRKFRRNAGSSATSSIVPDYAFECNGRIYVGFGSEGIEMGEGISAEDRYNRQNSQTNLAFTGPITYSGFVSGVPRNLWTYPEWSAAAIAQLGEVWGAAYVTEDVETTIVPTGCTTSLKIYSAGSTSAKQFGAYLRHNSTTRKVVLDEIAGRTVTLTAQVRMDAALGTDQEPKIGIWSGATILGMVQFKNLVGASGTGGWKTVSCTALIPPGAPSIDFYFFAHHHTSTTIAPSAVTTLYVGDVRLVIGKDYAPGNTETWA